MTSFDEWAQGLTDDGYDVSDVVAELNGEHQCLVANGPHETRTAISPHSFSDPFPPSRQQSDGTRRERQTVS